MNTYTEGYKRNYLTKISTLQHFFCIFIWYLIFALPFYFSFGGQKFWLKMKNQVISCNYNFTGFYAIQTNSISLLTTTSIQQQYSNIVGASISNLTLGSWSANDQIQSSQIAFSLTGFANKQIIDVNIIVYYKVWIQDLQKEISAAFVEHFAGDNSYTQMTGILAYDPQSPLNSIDNKIILNYPAYYTNLQPPSSFDGLMDFIIENQQVHRLSHQEIKTVASGTKSDQRNFKVKLIKDTKTNIPYYPSVLQTLKFSFSRWLAFVIIAYFVFYYLLLKLVKDGSLVTKIQDQIIS